MNSGKGEGGLPRKSSAQTNKESKIFHQGGSHAGDNTATKICRSCMSKNKKHIFINSDFTGGGVMTPTRRKLPAKH